MTEKEFLERIESENEFTERELKHLACKSKFEVDRIKGYCYCWKREIRTIVEIKGRYFAIDWTKGLTETQEDEFHNQPYEVFRKEIVETTVYWDENKEKSNDQ